MIAVLAIYVALVSEGASYILDWFLNGFGMIWNPIYNSYGINILIFNTFYAGIGCIAFATIIGLPTAIYLAEFADTKLRNIVKPCLEVLTGFPSVIIGIIGAVIVLSAINTIGGSTAGGGILAIWIVLGTMSIPTVVTISEDAIKAVTKDLKEASLGLGATRWQTVVRVIIPAAMPGILAAILLGLGNAMGETMAASFIVGTIDSTKLSLDLVHGTQLIPVEIIRAASGDWGADKLEPYYAAGFVLFVIIGALNLIIRRLSKEKSAVSPSKKRVLR